MLALKTLAASAALALTVPAFASPTTLDFETAPLVATKVLDTYLALGINFSASAWAAASKGIDPDAYGNFYNAPNDFTGDRGAVTLTSEAYPLPGQIPTGPNSFTISIKDGFDDFFRLRYTGEAGTTISAYDINGTLLTSISGAALSAAGCEPGFSCNWTSLQLDLTGTAAYSVTVAGTNGKQWFDDITFGNLLPAAGGPVEVPEPGGVALSLAALGALAWSRKRSKS